MHLDRSEDDLANDFRLVPVDADGSIVPDNPEDAPVNADESSSSLLLTKLSSPIDSHADSKLMEEEANEANV